MFGSSKDKTPIRTIDSAAAKQIDTVIAEQCTLEGDLTIKNSVKVDGRIQGTLRAEGRAIIGETGVVKGDVHAVDLLVLGRLEGNVHAQRLHLQASAQIHGNIEAETLQVDPGARYQGSVTMRDAGAAPAVLPFSPSAPRPTKLRPRPPRLEALPGRPPASIRCECGHCVRTPARHGFCSKLIGCRHQRAGNEQRAYSRRLSID